MNPKSRFFNQRGVTLIEVVVVIAVAGILAAVAAPTISNALNRERGRGFAHDVANQLREVRNQATARGEALAVVVVDDQAGNTPGRIKVWRTTKRMSTGNFTAGACNTDTEGITTFDCPDDAICMGNLCQGQPARSCRELDAPGGLADQITLVDVQYDAVIDEDFGGAADGNMGIRYAGSDTDNEFCFSPRGTLEDFGGTTILPYDSGGYSCPDESFNIWVADRDYSNSFTDVLDRLRCDSTPADYEEVRGHVVRVLPNGEIGLRPRRQP